MPIFGTRNVVDIDEPAPRVHSLSAEPVVMTNVHTLQVLVEAPRHEALSYVPTPFHPTNPPAVTFTVAHVDESVAGEFTFAHVGVVCRAGVRLRSYLLQTFVSTERAADFLRDGWGYRADIGDVELVHHYDRIVGRVDAGGYRTMEITLESPMPLSAADIFYMDFMNFAMTDEGPRLIQVDPEYVIKSAERGVPHLTEFDARAWGAGDIKCTQPITAHHTNCDITLPAVRFLCHVDRPATEGTLKLGAA